MTVQHAEITQQLESRSSRTSRRLIGGLGLLCVLAVALGLRLHFFVGYQGSDDLATWQVATALSEGNLKPDALAQNKIASMRYGPAFPTALAFAMFGNSEQTLLIYPIVMSLLAVVVVWDIVRRETGSIWAAHLAGAVLALTSIDIHYSSVALPDGPMTNVGWLAIWCLVVASHETDQQRVWLRRVLLFASGLLTAYAFWHKISAVQLVLAMVCWGVVQIIARRYRHDLFLAPAGFVCGGVLEHLFFAIAYGDFLHRWNVIREVNAKNIAANIEAAQTPVSAGERLGEFVVRLYERFPSMSLLIATSVVLAIPVLLMCWRRPGITLVSCYALVLLAMRPLELTQTFSFQPRRFLPFAGCAAVLLAFVVWRWRAVRSLVIFIGIAFVGFQTRLMLQTDILQSVRDRDRIAASRWIHNWIHEHRDDIQQHGLHVDHRTAKILFPLSGFASLESMNIHMLAAPNEEEHAIFGTSPERYEEGAYVFVNVRLLDWLLPHNYQSEVFEVYRHLPDTWTPVALFQHKQQSNYNGALYRVTSQPNVLPDQTLQFPIECDDSDRTHDSGKLIVNSWRFENVAKQDHVSCTVDEGTENGVFDVDLTTTPDKDRCRLINDVEPFWLAGQLLQRPVRAGTSLMLRWLVHVDQDDVDQPWADARVRIRGYTSDGNIDDLYDRRLRLYYDAQVLRGYVIPQRDYVDVRVGLEFQHGRHYVIGEPVLQAYENLSP